MHAADTVGGPILRMPVVAETRQAALVPYPTPMLVGFGFAQLVEPGIRDTNAVFT